MGSDANDFLKPPQAAAPEHKKSYLDLVAENTVAPVFKSMLGEDAGSAATGLAKEFVKTVPLFMKGELPFIGMAATYAADEAKVGDSLSNNLLDGGLGIAKTVALKGSFHVAQHYNFTPTMTGVSLGIMNRVSDSALTRSTWADSHGQFDFTHGLTNTFSRSLRPEQMAMDALSFGAADVVWGKLYSRTRGAAYFDPVISNTLAGMTMGATNSGGMELMRQIQSGHYDPLKFITQTTAGATVNGLAGAVGGFQTRAASRIDYSGRADFNDRPQTEHSFFSDAQRNLQQGTFIPNEFNSKLTQAAWTGKVVMPDGHTVPAIFRPDNGTPAFRERMLAETSITAADALSGRDASLPVAVARTVEINGQPVNGFIQEMQGKDLRAYLADRAIAQFGSDSVPNMVKAFNADPALKASFGEAIAKKAFSDGEWDNHAMNQIVVDGPHGPKVKNIDLQDALKPAQYAWDLRPNAGFLRGWEGLNQKLYAEFAGKPIPEAVRQQSRDFVTMYDNPIGRMRLQEATGWSYQQMEGVIGRNKYLAGENSIYPHAQFMSVGQPALSWLKRLVKTGSISGAKRDLNELRLSGED
jgi:hypothetical protein